MKLLSDPHVLLWALSDDPELRPTHREAIATGDLYLFATCIREIGVRRAPGKLDVPDDLFEVAARNGCRSLPITLRQAEVAAALYHPPTDDPLDRMLLGRACCEVLMILIANQPFQRNEVGLIIRVGAGILRRLRGRRGYDFERPAD